VSDTSAAQARRSETCPTELAHARHRHEDARGLEISPGSIPQNEVVQRQIRYGLAKPAVLELKLLQTLHLLDLQPAKLLTPAIVGNLARADLPDRLRRALAADSVSFLLIAVAVLDSQTPSTHHEANTAILTPHIPAMIAVATMALIATHVPQRRSARP
jgi:hypothetical protein